MYKNGKRKEKDGAIGIFDSGVGGLKILGVAKRRLPDEDFIYVFDRSHSPYGSRGENSVKKRALFIAGFLADAGAKAIVIACNTATCAAIDAVRAKHRIPIVGVEPPIKPAAEASRGGKILVLATPLTASTARFRSLVERHDRGNIIVSPEKKLASLVENAFPDVDRLQPDIDAILAPFDNENIESVVLGCTHYYFVRPFVERHYAELRSRKNTGRPSDPDTNVQVYTAETAVAEHLAAVLGYPADFESTTPLAVASPYSDNSTSTHSPVVSPAETFPDSSDTTSPCSPDATSGQSSGPLPNKNPARPHYGRIRYIYL